MKCVSSDSLPRDKRIKLFLLFEHYSLALGEIACPLPQGFIPFFTYLGYRVVPFDQFLWHVRCGTFDLQIDIVKAIMNGMWLRLVFHRSPLLLLTEVTFFPFFVLLDLPDTDDDSVGKKLHLISLLPKSRASRVLNSWSHPRAICVRARQHSSDLLHGVISQSKKSSFVTNRKWKGTRKSLVCHAYVIYTEDCFSCRWPFAEKR